MMSGRCERKDGKYSKQVYKNIVAILLLVTLFTGISLMWLVLRAEAAPSDTNGEELNGQEVLTVTDGGVLYNGDLLSLPCFVSKGTAHYGHPNASTTAVKIYLQLDIRADFNGTERTDDDCYDILYVNDSKGNQIACYDGRDMYFSKSVELIVQDRFFSLTLERKSAQRRLRVTDSTGSYYWPDKYTTVYAPEPTIKITGLAGYHPQSSLKMVTRNEDVDIISFEANEGATSVTVEQSSDGIDWIPAKTLEQITQSSTDVGVYREGNRYYRLNVTGGYREGISNVISNFVDSSKFVFSNGTITNYTGSQSFVVIPTHINGEEVVAIGDSALAKSYIETVIIPDSVLRIGSNAFTSENALFKSNLKEVIIEGNNLIEIGKGAFKNCKNLEKVVLPDSVESVGAYAFYGCQKLTILELPPCLRAMGEWCFGGVQEITNLKIPDDINAIPTGAFSNIQKVRRIYIGKEVVSADTLPITNEYLEAIEVSKLNPNYSANDGVLYNKDQTVLIRFPKSLCIVSERLDYGYYTTIVPEGVTKINNHAFSGCKGILELVLPQSVVEIGSRAFYKCDFLRVRMQEGLKTIGTYAFAEAGLGGYIYIPDSVTNIGNNAFEGCSFSYISWPSGTSTIQNAVFKDCSFLSTIYIPRNVTTIKEYAFSGCDSLYHVFYGGAYDNWKEITIKDYNIPLTSAKSSSYTHNDLAIAYQHEGFLLCKGDTLYYYIGYDMAVTIPSKVNGVEITTIRNNAFDVENYIFGEEIFEVTIPNTVVSIGAYAFRGQSLKEIVFGEGINSIGANAFSECRGIKNVYYCGTESCWNAIDIQSGNSLLTIAEINYHKLGDEIVIKHPTCSTAGEKYGICTVCEKTVTVSVSATGTHDYKENTTEPTCTKRGYTTHTCVTCGYEFADNYTNAKGHAYNSWQTMVAATCTKDGVECRKCSACQIEETRTVSATGHRYSAVITSPTCTEKGYATNVCATCGNSYIDSYTEAKGHSYGAWQTRTAATCTKDGVEYRKCSACRVEETRAISATGHKYTTAITPPTCTEKGYTTHTCTCGNSYVDNYTNAKGHTWDDGVVTITPTEEKEGERRYTCQTCGLTRTEALPRLDHVHRYDAVTTEPTCTEQGYTTHMCSCGDSYVDGYTAAKGHSYSAWQVETAATCTKDGEEYRKCSACQDEKTRPIAATGHNHKAVVTAPTCTAQGYTTHTCATCGNSYIDSYTEAKGHAYGVWQIKTAVTCTKDGVEYRKCSVCQAEETRPIAATGHNYRAVVTSATCTERGYTTHTCATCGNSYVDSYTNAKSHSYSGWQIRTAATCTKNGVEYRKCTVCQAEETRTIVSTGHAYKDVLTAPTCKKQGFTTHTCTACGYSYIDSYVGSTGHSYSAWQIRTKPTCVETGTEFRQCSACGFTQTREIDAIGHKYTDVITAPTCTAQGYTTHTCATCGNNYIDSYIAAKGHSYGTWHTRTAATCTKEGVEYRKCSTCQVEETRPISAIGHNHKAVVTAPTCTAQGYTTYTCVCGDSYVDNYTVAKGHSYGIWHTRTAATCTKDGVEYRKCSACQVEETRAISAPGHKYTTAITPPTCTEKGYTTHTCTCGNSYVDSYTNARGHAWDDGVVTVTPTEEKEGERRYTCQTCGATKIGTIPTLDHVHKYDANVTNPTCVERGYTTHICRCGDSYIDNYIDAKGHSYGAWQIRTAATCTKNGVEYRKCSGCQIEETRPISATGHKHKAVVTAPTCTAQGYTTHTCTCGDSYVDSYTAAKGHFYGAWQTRAAATCTKDGVEYRQCAVCQIEETRTLSSAGHSYKSVTTEPTCTEKGYTTHTCHCGDVYADSYVNALGHKDADKDHVCDNDCDIYQGSHVDGNDKDHLCDYGCGVALSEHSYADVVTEPTCTEKGYTTRTCACGDTYVTDEVSAKGHADANKDYMCDICGTKLCTNHTEETIHGTAATCEQVGLTDGRKCSTCGEILQPQEEIPATGHRFIGRTTAPSCTEQGYTTYTCENCNDSYTDDYVDVIAHSYGEWTQVKVPTADETGLEERVCGCGDKQQRELAKLEPSPTEPEPTDPAPTEPKPTKPGTQPTVPEQNVPNATDDYAAEPKDNDGNAIIAVAVVATLCGVGGVIVFLVLKKRKRI